MAEKKFSIRALLYGDVKDFKKGMNDAKKVNGSFIGSIKGVGKTLKSAFGSFLGITAVIFGAIKAIGSIVRSNKEFQQSLSSLSAITGLSGDDLNYFAEQAKKTSKETLQGANNIVKAYELVGSIRPELLKNKEALAEVTKQAIILSEATGGKLALEDAAKATAGTLNQFGLASEEANRVINVLAAGSKEGAAAVVEQTQAIEQFGAVANASNVSLQQSVGLIETLAEKQIVGAEAGTKLRNILLILQQDQKNYKNGVFDLNLALQNLQNENLSAIEMTDRFGKQNVVAAQILATNVSGYKKYTDAVTGTNTALEQQAIQNDNVAANWKRLTNIIQSAFLSTKGTGFLNDLVKGLIKMTEKVVVLRDNFVSSFNDLIRSSATFRAIISVVGQAVKLNFKLMINSALLAIEPFILLGRVIKDALTGNWENIKNTVGKSIDSIRNRVNNMKNDFIDAGKAIAAAISGENIDSLLINTSQPSDSSSNVSTTSSTTPSGGSNVDNSSIEARKKTLEKIQELEDEYYRNTASVNERAIEDIQRKYEKEIEAAMAAKVSKEDISRLEILMNKEINDLFLKQQEEALKKEADELKESEKNKAEIRKNLGIASLKETYNQELQELKDLNEQKLISDEEYLKAKVKLEKQYQDETLELASRGLSDIGQLADSTSDSVKFLFGSEAQSEIENFVESIDNVVNGLQSILNVFKAINNIIQAFNTLTEIAAVVTNALTNAKKKETSASLTNAAASGTEAGIDATGAIAKSAKSASSIPVIGWILAIAAIAGITAALLGAFKSVKSGAKMASGGIAFGETHAIIGEYANARTNPEVVAPLDKLQGMLQTNPVIVGGEIKFKQGVLSLALSAETNKKNSYR